MSADYLELIEGVCSLIKLLPRFDHTTPHQQLPENGVYAFFELGEVAVWRGVTIDRVVRIGTHKKDRRFRKRMRQHYGNSRSLSGNKNGSVFRKHLGGALLRRVDPQDPRLRPWLKQNGPSFADIEESVSRILRGTFTFSCFRVDDQADRFSLESGLIALFARFPPGTPSPNWLGRYAASEKINGSGL